VTSPGGSKEGISIRGEVIKSLGKVSTVNIFPCT
jgi:hypothetical protein